MAKSTYTLKLQERRERLTKTGMWSTFVSFRERLKKAGVNYKLASEFADLACNPTAQYPLTPDRMDIAVACALAGIEPHSPAWSVAMSTGRLPDYDSSVKPPGSLAGSGATGRPPSAVREPAAADSASPAGNPSLLGPTPATPLPDWRPASGTGAAPTATADSWTDELDQSLTAQNVDPAYSRLLASAIGKRATQRAEIIWVNEVLLLRLERIDPDTVPSQGAVALLEWVRQSAQNRSAFMTTLYAKTIQTRLQAETDSDEVGHDGRTVEELLESFERQLGPVLRPRSQDAA